MIPTLIFIYYTNILWYIPEHLNLHPVFSEVLQIDSSVFWCLIQFSLKNNVNLVNLTCLTYSPLLICLGMRAPTPWYISQEDEWDMRSYSDVILFSLSLPMLSFVLLGFHIAIYTKTNVKHPLIYYNVISYTKFWF